MNQELNKGQCQNAIKHVEDALYVLSGKWKLPILIALKYGNKRFGQLAKEIPGITERMLSKELRSLDQNLLVKRTVYDTIPVTVEYSLTKHGESLDSVIQELYTWGQKHRNVLKSENKVTESPELN